MRPFAARNANSAQLDELILPLEPESTQPTPPHRQLGAVVGRILAGESNAAVELHSALHRVIRNFALRQVGPVDAEDVVQETFLITLQTIQRGTIRNYDAIPGFARTVARRHIIRLIEQRTRSRSETTEEYLGLISDPKSNPEREVLASEKVAVMVDALKAMSSRDREILTRFYLHEQTKEQICAEMCLTATQFRLVKSRAKLSLEKRCCTQGKQTRFKVGPGLPTRQ